MRQETKDKIRLALLAHYERRRRGEGVEPAYGDSLRGYGYEVMKRDNFVCQYCGYDGRDFLTWLQLTVDHIKPAHQDGRAEPDNLVTVCHWCNSVTSRMKFSDDASKDEILGKKKERVSERRRQYREFWSKMVAH